MKCLIILVLVMLLCSGCTALPAEERAFAVAMCVEKWDVWRVHGRIPTYQSGGGYMTVTGEGSTFARAMSAMDAAAPIRINLSQMRLLVLADNIVLSGDVSALLTALAERPDVRMQCAVAVTTAPANEVAEALKPSAGARLSKALELMVDARLEQGIILPATLSDVLRMGERQVPILMGLSLTDGEIALSGGYTLDGARITGEETALLSLLLGSTKERRLELPEGSARVRDVASKVCLSPDLSTARVELTLTATTSSITEIALEQALAERLCALLARLSAEGCDVLGLGRQAIVHTCDMPSWHALDWPSRVRGLRWDVAVAVKGAT